MTLRLLLDYNAPRSQDACDKMWYRRPEKPSNVRATKSFPNNC